LLGNPEQFHLDVRFAGLIDFRLTLCQDVRQQTQSRSHDKAGWINLPDLCVRASEIAHKE
jgi:hypothetical protein